MRNYDKSKRRKRCKDNVIIPYLSEEYYIGFSTAMNFWGPDRQMRDAEYSQDSKKMLEIDLKQEQETIKHYREVHI